MPDDLRTRIAAVLERNLAEQLFSDLPDRYYKWIGYDELADAVIAALGLEVTVTAKSNDGRFRACSIEGYWEDRKTNDD